MDVQGRSVRSLVTTAWELIWFRLALTVGPALRLPVVRIVVRHIERPCHCLCGLHAKTAPGVCLGDAVPGLTVTRFSELTGHVHIPMCRPCFEAAGGR